MKKDCENDYKYVYSDIEEWVYNKNHIFLLPYKNHKFTEFKKTYDLKFIYVVLITVTGLLLSLFMGFITGGSYKLWIILFIFLGFSYVYAMYLCFLNDVTDILTDDFVPIFASGINIMVGYITYLITSRNKIAFVIAFFISSYILIKALKYTNFESENKKPEK